VEGPAVSLCPSDQTAPNKSHGPPLCHPERSAWAVLSPISANLFRAFRRYSHRIVILRVCNFIGFAPKPVLKTKSLNALKRAKINKVTGSERSASQIDRVTQRLWRGVEGPRRCLIYPCCSELFHHRRTTTGSAATRTLWFRVHLFIHCLVLGPQEKTLAGPAVRTRWWKSSEQHG
jgi:hypothetical protein